MDYNYLEEPPPVQRTVLRPEPRRKAGWFASRSDRRSSRGRDLGTVTRPHPGKGILLLSVAAGSLLIVQGWLYQGVRRDLADMRTGLDRAHNSLVEASELTKRFDQDYGARLARLADSIRSVFDYAHGQVQVLETNYARLGERLDNENSGRAASAGRTERAQRARLDALERQHRTQRLAFEALTRRAQLQENEVRTELRRMRLRVDSLRRLSRAVSSSDVR